MHLLDQDGVSFSYLFVDVSAGIHRVLNGQPGVSFLQGQEYFPSPPRPEILSVSINNFIGGVTRPEGELDKHYYPEPWSAI